MNIFLSEFVRTIIIMTISGGAVSLLLLAIRPLVRHRLPKTAQYYFWIVALFAFLVPVSLFNFVPERVENIVGGHIHVYSSAEQNIVGVAVGPWTIGQPNIETPNISPAPLPNVSPTPSGYTAPMHTPTQTAYTTMDSTVLLLIYPWLALAVLMYNLIGYAVFTKKLRNSYTPAREEEIALLTALATRKIPRLLRSKTAATPMLIGLFRPVIVLPDREYTPAQLQSILLHELTHMRRFDIAIKWLSLLTCALHWFNPLAWLARREINRTCELSCDEAVIRNMNTSNKRDYGNTLIDVATNTKIPMPVLSTTMCQEKRALKERLTAIMKSKKHTKLAIFVSMLIILTAILAACTLGASRNSNDANDDSNHLSSFTVHQVISGGVELPTPTSTPTTRQDFADIHIYETAQNLTAGPLASSPHLRIVDSRIHSFEHVLDFNHANLNRTIELWRLDFALRAEYEAFFSWGTFTPDEDGWISNETAFSDAVQFLMFSQDGGVLTLETTAPWSWMGFAENVQALEEATRQHLQWNNILPPVDFPGDLSFVYVWLDHGSGDSGHFVRLLLSRPIRQGEGGVWMVERIEHLHDVPTTPVPTNMDDRAGILERLAAIQELIDTGQFQAMADAGQIEDQWHFTDPQGAAIRYLNNRPWHQDFIPVHVFPLLPEGTINPFEIPRSHGPEIIVHTEEELSRMQTQYPRFFSPAWGVEDCEFTPLREQKLAELGGLAFNEAYHFRTDDGRYALIAGWRPLISREELVEFTGVDVPQQIGGFTLVGVATNDNIFDSIIVYNNPIPSHMAFETVPHDRSVFGLPMPLPINVAFTRDVVLRNFYALYVNDNGDYVAMGVTDALSHFDPMYLEHLLSFTPFSLINTLGAEIALIGADDRYAFAYYASTATPGMGIELGLLTPTP